MLLPISAIMAIHSRRWYVEADGLFWRLLQTGEAPNKMTVEPDMLLIKNILRVWSLKQIDRLYSAAFPQNDELLVISLHYWRTC